MDLNNPEIQEAIRAAIAAALPAAVAAAIQANPPQEVPPAPTVTAFARTPAQANTGLISLTSSEGMKIHNAAIVPLTNKFDGTAENMHMFLKNIKDRGQSFGWDNILSIPDEEGKTRNLIDQYGLITLNSIRAHATVYEAAQGRDAQNATQMYMFLYASISEETKLSILSDSGDYTVETDGQLVPNGPLFLKTIIRTSTVDTRSTVFHIRENLNSLDTYMATVTYNIELFNQYVKGQTEALAARGETSSDLLINLFSAYGAVPDKKFVEQMERQKDKFDDGEDVTVKTLMQVALIRYKDRKRSGLWQAPSAEEEQIIALTAQVKGLQKKKNGVSSKSTKDKKSDATKTPRRNDDPKYAWKLVAPKPGEPTTKEWSKKTYHFCPNHQAWCLHKQTDCTLGGSEQHKTSGEDKHERSSGKPKISLTTALKTIYDNGGHSDDEESDYSEEE
jgi:hypothetical protein